MKTLGKTLGGIVILLFIVGIAVYFLFIRPGHKFIEQNKDQFRATAKLLIDCLENYQAVQCSIYLSDAANKAIPAPKLEMFANAIRSKLGKRVDGVLVDESIKWQKFAGTGGSSFSVSFQMKVIYEKDANVVESYRVINKGDSTFLIEFFKINSDKLLQ
jgi:hypothetical protein